MDELIENKSENSNAYLLEGVRIDPSIKEKLINAESVEECVKIIHELPEETVFKIRLNLLIHKKKDLQKYVRGESLVYRIEETNFISKHELIWGQCFQASEFFYSLVANFKRREDKKIALLSEEIIQKNNNRINVLNHTLLRALQQFLEVLVLNKNGLPEGALGRTRSLTELAICTGFVFNNDDNDSEIVAEAYWNTKPEDPDYHWAKSSVKFKDLKRKVFLSDIQEYSGIPEERTKPLYNATSKIIHADPIGTINRIATKSRTIDILSWRTHEGIKMSAVESAYYLREIASRYLGIFPDDANDDYFIGIRAWETELEVLYSNIDKEYNDIFAK